MVDSKENNKFDLGVKGLRPPLNIVFLDVTQGNKIKLKIDWLTRKTGIKIKNIDHHLTVYRIIIKTYNPLHP